MYLVKKNKYKYIIDFVSEKKFKINFKFMKKLIEVQKVLIFQVYQVFCIL